MGIMTFCTVSNCKVYIFSRIMTILTRRYHAVFARGVLVMTVYARKILKVSPTTGIKFIYNISVT